MEKKEPMVFLAKSSEVERLLDELGIGDYQIVPCVPGKRLDDWALDAPSADTWCLVSVQPRQR